MARQALSSGKLGARRWAERGGRADPDPPDATCLLLAFLGSTAFRLLLGMGYVSLAEFRVSTCQKVTPASISDVMRTVQ